MTDTYTPPVTVAERVAAGAAYLDSIDPAWPATIQVGTLDMGDSCCCVVGQYAGTTGREYWRFIDDAIPDDMPCADDWAVTHGFDANTYVGADRDYVALRDEWVRVITARQAAL